MTFPLRELTSSRI